MTLLARLVCVVLSVSLSGCAITSKATNFNGLKYVDGSVPVHINLTKVALHFGIVLPLIGDATLDGAVEDFTKEAINEGARRVRIVQSNETTLWWILPPLSFIFTPRFTNVAGDALK
jgi:hypothetical protein